MVFGNMSLDDELAMTMEMVYQTCKLNPYNKDTDEQLRMRVVSNNLKSLANILLIADDRPNEMKINLKQLTLGLLSTADWLSKDLPPLEPEIIKNAEKVVNNSEKTISPENPINPEKDE